MEPEQEPIRGRGASSNPANRFELIHYERDEAISEEEAPAPATRFYRDHCPLHPRRATTVPMSASRRASIPIADAKMAVFIAMLVPPTSISASRRAWISRRRSSSRKMLRHCCAGSWPRRNGSRKSCRISGVTDPYQPIERRLGLTRRCLEVFAEFRNPVGVVTKNHLICRDIDLLAELAQHQAAAAFLSITTLDAELARRMEPRATQPAGRLAAIEELTRAGVPVGVLVAPVIPGLTDHELPAILEAAAKAGAVCAGYVLLRLPHGLGPLFEQWLRQHYPERCDKVLSRLRDMRGGEIYDPVSARV